ncbi:glycosyltransferase family 4 protein [Nocardioides sp. zg-536]|uniref:Glycosyltransferase family 4 protein n=1 Tax=Nocardioides faecalis TaxID=2803858 RepID=A0A938Y1W3_9ACTN|nr:glycosyltransferase family 1 protein [Nocardioides faecalis]MBM9458388.1 glycosyltransferase family 4 protein [Nocardioides faecalis]QVI58407.1 glycosyltransferase family 4 protein [Nocardioides faecalis]
MTVYVDRRYDGAHGIGRYAREIYSRMELEFVALPTRGNPVSPTSLASGGWLVPNRNDVIYSPGFGTGFSRARQLLTVHDLIHLTHPSGRTKARLQRVYYERAVRQSILRTGHVMTVSEVSAGAIREWLVDESVEIHVTGNGCSDSFTPDGAVHLRDRPYALFVGNAKPHKNPGLVFAALSRISDLDLVVVTADWSSLAPVAAAAGVLDRIIVVSGVDDDQLAEYYRGAEVLLFPSIVEGFGLPVLEALKCHTPVVYCSIAESVAEICEGTQFAVSDPGDIAGYATAIEVALDSQFAAPPSLAGYDWANVARRVDAVLKRLIDEVANG